MTVEQLVSMLDIIHAFISPSVLSFLIPVFFPFHSSPFSQNTSNCMNNSNVIQKAFKNLSSSLCHSISAIFNNICCSFILVLLCSPIRELHERWCTPLLYRYIDLVRLCSDRGGTGSYHLKSRERGGRGLEVV